MAERPTLQSGSRLGPYEVVAVLGAGAMGVVYRARDTRLGREVALKVLPESFAAEQGRLHRFELEARAASALNHPNIVALHDVGTHQGTPYLVMELLEGQPLRQLLEEGPMPVRKALALAVQVAQGLAAAHEKNIVHRDVKPENLFVTRDERVKILDFGLAKPLADDAVGKADGTLGLSETGAVLGTAGYMSPEQVRGLPVDQRSDIFSFGAVFYEMLAGVRAFAGTTSVERGYAILNGEPPDFAEAGAMVPLAVQRIVRRCLEKAPAARFQSARDLGFALEAVGDLSSGRSAGLPARGPSRRGGLTALLVVTTLGLAAFGARRVWKAPVAPEFETAVRPLPRFKRVSFREGWVGTARFGPGDTVFYDALFGGGPYQVYEATLGKPEARPVGPPSSWLWDASRKGELLLGRAPLMRGGQSASLSVMTANGVPREVANDVWVGPYSYFERAEATLGPDGHPVALVRRKGSQNELEFPVGKSIFQTGETITWLRASPNFDAVAAFVSGIGDVGWLEVFFKDGSNRRLSGPWGEIDGIAWSADSREIWFAAGGADLRSVRAVTLEGQEREVLAIPGGVGISDLDARGRALLIVRSYRARTVGRGLNADREINLSWHDLSFPVDISTDGRTLLMTQALSQRAFLRPIDGSPPVDLAETGVTCLSPDGTWAAGGRAGDIVLVPTGAGEIRHISQGRLHTLGIVCSKDGSHLVLWAFAPGESMRLWSLPLDGGTPTGVSGEHIVGSTGQTSPDGKWIGVTYEDGGSEIVSLTGRPPRPVPGLSPGDILLDWSVDGGALFVKRPPATLIGVPVEVDRLDLATGRRSPWLKLSPPDMTGVDPYGPIVNLGLALDGRAYGYGYWGGTSDLYLVEGLGAPVAAAP